MKNAILRIFYCGGIFIVYRKKWLKIYRFLQQIKKQQKLTCISRRTATYRIMSNNTTISTRSTRPWAWISAALRHTSLVIRTIIVNLAFRFAFHIGISKIVWRTFASSCLAQLLALCILSTRIWITRVSFYRLHWRWFGDTLSEWIADVVIGTRANGVMVHLGIDRNVIVFCSVTVQNF